MATKKAGSRAYKKVSCHKTKTTAKSEAKKMRDAGKTAQVKKSAAGVYCVYSAGKRKMAKRATATRRRSK